MTDQTRPLAEQQLDEIAARAAAATAGPWGFYDGDNYADVAADMQVTSPGSYNYREKVARLEDENYWDDSAHENDDEERAPEQMRANAAFIAHARTDVPALLAEVRRLRAELATALRPNTPRLCACGHGNHAHTVPAPHSCFAFGQTCPCRSFQQLPHDEAVAQLARNVEAAERRRAAEEQPAAEGAQR